MVTPFLAHRPWEKYVNVSATLSRELPGAGAGGRRGRGRATGDINRVSRAGPRPTIFVLMARLEISAGFMGGAHAGFPQPPKE